MVELCEMDVTIINVTMLNIYQVRPRQDREVDETEIADSCNEDDDSNIVSNINKLILCHLMCSLKIVMK